MSLLRINDLKVHFPIRRGVVFDRTIGHVRAVDGVSLEIQEGQTYGLVGESGCGKTTLGRAVLRLVDVTEGEVLFGGRDLAGLDAESMRRERRNLQMVFQDPLGSLNPRQNIGSILLEGLQTHGIGGPDGGGDGPGAPAGRSERRKLVLEDQHRRVVDALERVGLSSKALTRYPHEFSGGQRQRIGIARALVLEPDLIICDEPVSALDVSIQAQVLNLLESLQQELGLTYLVIAHDLAVVRHVSDVVGVMYLGALVEEASSDELYETPMHPYTRSLMSAVPVPDPEVEDARERILLSGDLPSPANPPSGCRFHTRCPWRQEELCDTERPELRPVRGAAEGSTHRVACHYAEQILAGEIRPDEKLAERIVHGVG
ncbi:MULTISPECIES: ABC transporter ATP-binding protein [Nocardiopsidaceae]|uniref:ATP-binding cassette domain-containing protein n=2 Tax=Nocardiopsidaceae TaxID=83676 RepID=A0ABY6YR40_9ACTN|nr:oligopeptide/dipeptide ABC transporter ATP-binding protein [Streptomonospora nanhaiensis]WAE74632.1 ATP-binding cassette domain-containing protein [Streptomonospora nanhaiensis]